MSVATAAGCLAALPWLLLALAADLVERSRLHRRVDAGSGDDGARGSGRSSAVTRVALATSVGLAVGFAVWRAPGAVVGAAAGAVVPILRARRTAAVGRREAERQLAPAAGAVAAGLRAGRSIVGSILVAADEVGPPLGPSLREVVDRVSLGTPLAASLDTWAMGTDSPDARLLVGVLLLHARSGGEMPMALDRLAETLRARAASVAELRSMTAQARLSGAILGFLPIGFLLFLLITSSRDVVAAIEAPTGLTALVVGLVLEGFAFLWIRRLLRVEP